MLLAALAVGAVAYWRARAAGQTGDVEFERGRIAHRRNLAALAMSHPDGVDDIDSRLISAKSQGEDQVSDRQIVQLRRAVAEFLDLYIRCAPPEEIAGWRRRSGYQPRTLDEIRSRYPGFDDQLASGFGAGLPPDATWDDLWISYLNACRREQGPSGIPAALASGPQAAVIGYGWHSRANPNGPAPDPGIEHAVAFINSATSSPSWWTHAENLESQLGTSGRVLGAMVMLAVEFADGRRRPVALRYVWAPSAGAWVLESIATGERPGIGWGY